jgi:tetratricopeptide (TPR) repeat protein
MKKLLIFLPVIFLSAQFVAAQQTQADIDKMMKQAQDQMKKYARDTSVNKMLKNLQDQQKQISDAMKNGPAGNNAATNASLYPDPSEYGNVDNWKFPAKNAAILSSLPKKIFTKAELVNFLNDTYAQLAKKLPPGIGASVQSIAAKYNNDGSKMGDAAVTGWYTNYREESLLLIIKAAAINPDDGLLLNNCAAILNMGGIEQRAIPILKYLLQFNTGSSMVLNNLGQAYAGLGETDTAMVYLGRCIKIEPENPEANNTAGQIEAIKGNTDKAISYFEQSIKGAYNKPAELKLRKIKKNSKIAPLVRPRIKLPEYFNQFKYKLPAQCTSTNNAAVAKAEYIAFRAMIIKQIENYGGKIAQLQSKLYQNPLPTKRFKKDDFAAQPFSEFCGIMAGEVTKEFHDNIGQYDKKFYADYLNLENEYKGKFEAIKKNYKERDEAASKAGCCGEGNVSCCVPDGEECKALNDLANEYLPKYAMLTEDWQEKNKDNFNKLFDEVIYWNYLHMHPVSDDYFRINCFYPLVTEYLGMLGKVGTTKIIEPCHFEPTTATADSNTIKDYDCPLNIQIPFAVGKIQLNCDKFSVSGGEGAVFGYERNFKTHQSTLSAGIGLTLELTAKAGPVKAGVSATATETAFITFDGNNGIADIGIKNEAKLSASATGVGKKEVSVGSTLGINSGYNFAPGPFKGMGDPKPEVQVNKNVPIYKTND